MLPILQMSKVAKEGGQRPEQGARHDKARQPQGAKEPEDEPPEASEEALHETLVAGGDSKSITSCPAAALGLKIRRAHPAWRAGKR